MLRPGLIGSTYISSATTTIRVKHWDINTWVFDKGYRPNASPLPHPIISVAFGIAKKQDLKSGDYITFLNVWLNALKLNEAAYIETWLFLGAIAILAL